MNDNANDSNRVLVQLSDLIQVTLGYLDNSNEILKEISINNKGKAPVIYTKEEGEKFTEGDWVLQKYFEELYHDLFLNITIIGEEDTSYKLTSTIDYKKYLNTKLLITNDLLLDPLLTNSSFNQKELTVYIDPIDATNQYINGNYDPVTMLIGICQNNIPLLGFIHYPLISHPITYFNIPSKGIYSHFSNTQEINKVNLITKSLNEWTFNISQVNNLKEKQAFISQFPKTNTSTSTNIVESKGLGNKAMQCILNDQIYLSINKGLGLWDICASDCIAHELGGGYYHFDLSPITYIPKRTWYDLTMFFCSSQPRKNSIATILIHKSKK